MTATTPRSEPRLLRKACATLALTATLAGFFNANPAQAQATPQPLAQAGSDTVLEAREALRKKDRNALAATRATAVAGKHPLAIWVDYWELTNRIADAQQEELNAFYQRWPGTYLEDRLRNDWLLELGKRRDWVNLRAEYPRFKLNDDREVTCYALLARHLQGDDVRNAGLAAWAAQRDADDGCSSLGIALFDAKQLTPDDAWRRMRLAVEANKPRLARQVADLLGPDVSAAVGELSDNPQRYLARKGAATPRPAAELTSLALIRSAANDPDATATAMRERWGEALPGDLAGWTWASIGKQAALKLSDNAPDYFTRAALPRKPMQDLPAPDLNLPDDTLAWKLRAALRADGGVGRWQQVMQAITAMSATEQRDPAWIYWKSRALQALATSSTEGAAMAAESRELLASIASPLHFYGKLAAEETGRPLAFPPRPAAVTAEERAAVVSRPGLQRALLLFDIGLRSEAVREWNFTLVGMNERELLAAAQLACERQVWDRCINTSERTREQVDIAQRFPMPYQSDVVARAKEAGIDPAYVYGLIRQESRFVSNARSVVGASGLMQLMPSTAKWTARKLGVDYAQSRIDDQTVNLRLGTGYLRLMLDSFEGSQALAAAGYNAGPGRPRRWREGPALDPVVWIENIPFSETRDYVKKVLSNTADYASLMSGEPASLRARLGTTIGPRTAPLSPTEKEMP